MPRTLSYQALSKQIATVEFGIRGGEAMLIYRRTSLLESTAQTLVNTVNCVGVMGKGLARAFKDRDPQMFEAYKRICDQKLLKPGGLWLWRGADFWTLNFATKNHWRNPSRMEWIEQGLQKFVAGYERQGIREISFPRLGCGNGGLDWDDVRPLMEHYLSRLPIQIYIHDYTVDRGLPEHLEEIASLLRSEQPLDGTFESFVAALRRAVTLADSKLVDLETKTPIEANFEGDGSLRIAENDVTWAFDKDDLWGVWVGLQKGLLTKEKAGWSTDDGGRALLNVLSLLPNVRPVEIERPTGAGPELALELWPGDRSSEVAPKETPKQLTLSWH